LALEHHTQGPGWVPEEAYIHSRWEALRKPLNLPISSAYLDDDLDAIHAWISNNEKIISVGRIHLIPPQSDGAMADHSGEGAPTCPAFTPLNGENNFPPKDSLRPAAHIRQMATTENQRRKGHAASVLHLLEQSCVEQWGCKSGWLQARVEAIPFYRSQGWKEFGSQYHIEKIGPHMSMWKPFRGV
jgi:predicted GNAT family N-acyltransferase